MGAREVLEAGKQDAKMRRGDEHADMLVLVLVYMKSWVRPKDAFFLGTEGI